MYVSILNLTGVYMIILVLNAELRYFYLQSLSEQLLFPLSVCVYK